MKKKNIFDPTTVCSYEASKRSLAAFNCLLRLYLSRRIYLFSIPQTSTIRIVYTLLKFTSSAIRSRCVYGVYRSNSSLAAAFQVLRPSTTARDYQLLSSHNIVVRADGVVFRIFVLRKRNKKKKEKKMRL